jgi:hypothetical protein
MENLINCCTNEEHRELPEVMDLLEKHKLAKIKILDVDSWLKITQPDTLM